MPRSLDDARHEFGDARGYLAAASMGLPPRAAVEAMRDDLAASFDGARTPADYGPAVERGRALYAGIVGVPVSDVAVGAQTSALASVVAGWVPAGGEVLTVEEEFTSITYPFLVRPDLTVRAVPLDGLAEAIGERTTLVVFSLVQSATGAVVDVEAVLAAAALHGARTFCDLTQAVGVRPVDASAFDFTVCHAYKWLCAPRGAAFLTVREGLHERVRPLQAGWYAGRDVWGSCYGIDMDLAPDARRFDVSPVWLAWVGAVPALELFADVDIAEIWAHSARLGAQLLEELGEPVRRQAIVTVPDPTGDRFRAVARAGVRAAGRASRLRLAFHLWNDEEDVARVVRALEPLRVTS